MSSLPFSAPRPRSLPTVSPNQPLEQTLANWRTQLNPLVENATPQATPLNFGVTSARGGLNLTWSPVTGGDGYEILKSANGSFTDDLQIIPIKDINQTKFFDPLGGNAQSASYRIRTTSGTRANPQSQRGPESGPVVHTSIDASDTKSVPTTILDSFTTDKTRSMARKGNYGAIKQNSLGRSGGATVASGTFTRGANPSGVPTQNTASFASLGTGTNSTAKLTVSSGASIMPDGSNPGVIDANQIQGTPITSASPTDGQIPQYSAQSGELVYVTPVATVRLNGQPLSFDSAVEVNNLNAVMGYVSPITVNKAPKFVPNHAISVNQFPVSDDYSMTVNVSRPVMVNGV